MKKVYLVFALLVGAWSLSAQSKVLLNEDFESGSTGGATGDYPSYNDPNMPDGWEVQSTYQGRDTTYRWHNAYSRSAMAGQHEASCDGPMFDSENVDSQTAWGPKEEILLTPELVLDGTYQLSFLWNAAIAVLNNQDYTMQVRVVEQGADAKEAPVVLDIADQESLYNSGVTQFPWTGWQTYASAIDLSAWQGKTVRIAFVHKMLKKSSANYTTIDNVKVEAFTPATAPVAEVTPTGTFRFGDTYLGAKKYSDQVYTLENTGLDGLTITEVTSTSPDFSTTIVPADVNLNRYETYQFQLVYEPTLDGASQADITIKTNGGDVTLQATGVKLPLTGGRTFEGFESGVPPVGWTGDADWYAASAALEGSISAVCQGSMMNDSAVLVSPRLDFSSTGGQAQTLNFTFFENYEPEGALVLADSKFTVDFSEDGGASWTTVFNGVEEFSDYGQIWRKSIDLPVTGSTNCLVRFVYTNPEMTSSDYAPELSVVYLDEVVLPPLYGANDTPGATTLSAPANGTQNVDNRDVVLSWNKTLFATGYKLYVGTGSSDSNVLNGQDVGDTNSYAFTDNLEYATTYNWKVVAYNDKGDSQAYASAWSFTTMEDQTITELPWSESFEGDAFPPLGWRVLSDNGYTEWDATNVGGYEGEQAAYVSPIFDASGSTLESPEVKLPADGQYQISFYWGNKVAGSLLVDETGLAKNNTTEYDGIDGCYFEVKAAGESEWTQLALLSDKNQDYWVRERVSLADYAGKTVTFRWRYDCTNYNKSAGVALDNIRLGAAADEQASFNVDAWNIGEQNYTWPISSGNVFTLINDGMETLTIESAAFTNACFTSTLTAGTAIAPDQGVQFGITFTPAEANKEIVDSLAIAFTSGYTVKFPVSVTVLPEDVMYYNFDQDEYGTLTPTDFTTVDVDRQATVNLVMVDYAHRGEQMAFVVLNRDKMDWPAHEARSGMQSLVAFGANTEKVDVEDWIISNPMTATDQSQFRFYAMNYEKQDESGLAFGNSQVSILVSENAYDENNLDATFVEVMGETAITPDGAWHEYTADLSQYAGKTIYVAVRHTVNDGLAAFFDDFYFEHFSGFNTTPPPPQSGVDAVSDLEVSVYPNPASDVLYLNGTDDATLTITSLSGVVVKKGAGVSQVDVSDLAEGMYLLTVETAEGSGTQRIVVKR